MVKREERTPGNDERTKEEKNQGEISGSIFDPEKGAAAEWGKGRRAGGGGQGEATRGRSTEGVAAPERSQKREGGVRKKSEKKEAPHIAEPGAAL